jgi:bifunctional enzyme CysN/CysC
VRARFDAPLHRIDVETLARIPAPGTLSMNDIGQVRLSVQQALPFEPYARQRVTGSFIVIDEVSNRTVAAGTVA